METDMIVMSCHDEIEMFNCIKQFRNFYNDELMKDDIKLKQYCRKVSQSGYMDYVKNKFDDLLAFIVYYKNDKDKTGYISLLCANLDIKNITPQIAAMMLVKNCLKIALSVGIKYVRVEVNDSNTHAINLYKRFGLQYEKRASDTSFYMFVSIKQVQDSPAGRVMEKMQ